MPASQPKGISVRATALGLTGAPLKANTISPEQIAAEDARRVLLGALLDSIKQYETAKIDYQHAEKDAIALYDRPPSPDAPPSNKEDAASLLGTFAEKFAALKEVYGNLLANLTACEEAVVTDEALGGSIASRRQEFEVDFNEIKQIFEKNITKLAQHTEYYIIHGEMLEKEIIKYNIINKKAEATVEELLKSINDSGVIFVTEMQRKIIEIESNLSDAKDTYDRLIKLYASSAKLNDESEKDIKNVHCKLLLLSDEALSEFEKIKSCARTDNAVDYTTRAGNKKTLIIKFNRALNCAQAKIAGVGIYTGKWENENPEGYGIFAYYNRNNYKGNLHAGVRHGSGVMRYADGTIYEGEWARGRPQGAGEQVWCTGSRFKGSWGAGVPEGSGVYINSDGLEMNVIMQNGYCNGIAKEKENFDCYHQLLLGATGQACRGYAEVALLCSAEEIKNTSLNTHLNLEEYTNYRSTMLGLVDQSRKWGISAEQERMSAWHDNLKANGKGLLFAVNIVSHALIIEILPPKADGGRYAVSIFNSGLGLIYHRKIADANKYETRLSVYFDADKIDYLQDVFVKNSRYFFENLYRGIIDNRSHAQLQPIDAQPTYKSVYQNEQKSGNCSIECWMALFKNKAVQINGIPGLLHYEMFRNDFFKHTLDFELKKIGASSQNMGEQIRDVEVISKVQQRTIQRLEEIESKAAQFFPNMSIDDVLMENAVRLYPGDENKQGALLSSVTAKKLQDNLAAINSSKNWNLNQVLLASAFSKIIKRNIRILALETGQKSQQALPDKI